MGRPFLLFCPSLCLALCLHLPSLFGQANDSVRAAVEASIAALNRHDAKAYSALMHQSFDEFLPGLPALLTFHPANLEKSFSEGLRFNIRLEDLRIRVYDKTALVTGYETGGVRYPDGSRQEGRRKYSSVWIVENDEWKNVHLHLSME